MCNDGCLILNFSLASTIFLNSTLFVLWGSTQKKTVFRLNAFAYGTPSLVAVHGMICFSFLGGPSFLRGECQFFFQNFLFEKSKINKLYIIGIHTKNTYIHRYKVVCCRLS